MKHIITGIFIIFIGGVNAQNVPVDFEQNGLGANWTWTTFENATNPPVEIVSNPDLSGINTSSNALKFTALQAGNPWAGFESLHGSDIGSFSLDSSNCTIKIMVWKSVISDVGIKLVDPTSAALPELKVSNTVVNRWEELTFDFCSRIGAYPVVKDQIVVFPDFNLNGRSQDNIVYIDNIYDTDNSVSGIDFKNNNKVFCFPNPVNEQLLVSVNKEYNAKIIDLHGKVQANKELFLGDNSIDLTFLSNGLYFLQLYNNNSLEETIKLIKK